MPDYKHLKFHKVIKGPAKYNGPRVSAELVKEHKNNRQSHSTNLNAKISHLEQYYNAYFANRKNKKFGSLYQVPFVLEIEPNSDLLKDLDKYGLNLISEDEEGFLLVATDKAGLNLFRRKLSEFVESKRGSGLIADIYEISKESLPKRRLAEDLYEKFPFKEDEVLVVDISIDCKGIPFRLPKPNKKDTELSYEAKRTQARLDMLAKWDGLVDERENNFYLFLKDYDKGWEIINERTMDNYDLENPPENFELRVKLNGKILNDIVINYPYVFEINLPDEFMCANAIITQENDFDLNIIEPDKGSCTVAIIDSGVQEAHKYIIKGINSELSKTYIDSENKNDNVRDGGHGTGVAGKVLYPEKIPTKGEYKLPCYIANTKILDSECKIPEKYIPADVYEKIVKETNHSIKIYNSSINSITPMRTKHMSSWGYQIDKLMNERDVLFIQSTGNIKPEYPSNLHIPGIQQMINNHKYPEYFYEYHSARIANPAQSLFALTVGSIAENEYFDVNTGLRSIEKKNNISSFSRIGFGLWNSIKPEVVEVGGGFNITEDGNIIQKEETSVEVLRTSPPGPAIAKDSVGTSYSTPKVSNLAAILQNYLPGHSALLYKTLIVHSAKWPDNIYNPQMSDADIVKIIRAYGYGIPDKDYALNNSYNRVTFITEDKTSIKSGDAHIYYIPIPESLRQQDIDTDIKITITLCYTSNPRRTRIKKRGYLSTWLDWVASKPDDTLDNFEKNIFKDLGTGINNQNQKWTLGAKNENDGEIDGVSRNNSTTQKDWQILKAYQLPEKYAVAVRSHKGWDLDPFSYAQYTLAVSIESLDTNLPIYSEIQLALENEIALENELDIK